MANKELDRLKEKFYSVSNIDDSINDLKQKFFLFVEDDDMREAMIRRAYDNFVKEQEKMQQCEPIYVKEIEYMKDIVDVVVRHLFYALLCYRKYRYHESGWINLDLKELRELACMPKLKEEGLEPLTRIGVEFRVYGKNNAMTVFFDPDALIYGYTAKVYEDDAICFLTRADCPYKFEDICCR